MNNASQHPRTIVLAGGGTGGHVLPALALAEAFRSALPDCQVFFIGTARGMESILVPKRGFALELVPGSRLVGGGISAKLQGLRALAQGVAVARKLLRARHVGLVVGVGGYASGAALLAAKSLGIFTAIHESNAVPGLTNRVLGKLVRRVYLGFAAAASSFPRARTVVSGNPVRKEIQSLGSQRAWRGSAPARILVVGGSQGSEFLNREVPGLLAEVAKITGHLEIRHQVGKLEAGPVLAAYAALGLNARVDAFIDDMATAYANTDFAITRSGSGTVSELAACGLPALLVPFPHAAGDHQAFNAKAFSDAGAGLWVRQGDWQVDVLAPKLGTLIADEAAWRKASVAAAELGKDDAATAVVADCLRAMEGHW